MSGFFSPSFDRDGFWFISVRFDGWDRIMREISSAGFIFKNGRRNINMIFLSSTSNVLELLILVSNFIQSFRILNDEDDSIVYEDL